MQGCRLRGSSPMRRGRNTFTTRRWEFPTGQFQVMQENEGVTEEESISIVEDLLAQEERTERLISRDRARAVVQERATAMAEDGEDEAAVEEEEESDGISGMDALVKSRPPRPPYPPSSTPNIAPSKPSIDGASAFRLCRTTNGRWARRRPSITGLLWTFWA